jgi:hypothetical protein
MKGRIAKGCGAAMEIYSFEFVVIVIVVIGGMIKTIVFRNPVL